MNTKVIQDTCSMAPLDVPIISQAEFNQVIAGVRMQMRLANRHQQRIIDENNKLRSSNDRLRQDLEDCFQIALRNQAVQPKDGENPTIFRVRELRKELEAAELALRVQGEELADARRKLAAKRKKRR